MNTILYSIGAILIIAILILLLICLLIPRARRFYWYLTKDSLRELKDIIVDYLPCSNNGIGSFALFLLAIVLVMLAAAVFFVLFLVAIPAVCIVHSFRYPKKIDDILQFDKDIHAPRQQKPKKTPEEIAEENRIWYEKVMSVRFMVDRKELTFDPDESEVFFFTPVPAYEVENAISINYFEIKSAFEQSGYSFIFLPFFNKDLSDILNADRLGYYNPKATLLLWIPDDTLCYEDLRTALRIPEKVDAPCFIRCKRSDEDPLVFSFFKINLPENGDIMPLVQEYLNNVGDGRMYHLSSDEEIRHYAEGKPADERFDTDVYLIGKEIRDRIAQLRAKGLSTLAIRKLIGDDSDKPGKLLIDRHNRLFLTDYGNKEIKLSPIHKAVFFLFLRHPEGIYFKDLGNYREELGRIYKEITGREDMDAVEESINKLTDPYDNSINEKCARIKNAFVSEFREEVAQWYFIDGSKGEKKFIKLPRELVTWEIKD